MNNNGKLQISFYPTPVIIEKHSNCSHCKVRYFKIQIMRQKYDFRRLISVYSVGRLFRIMNPQHS